jgi:hypothetical protein
VKIRGQIVQRLLPLLILFLAAPVVAQAESVQLSATAQLRMGVKTEALQAHEASIMEPAFLQALDIGALAALDAELLALAAGTEVSERTFKRSSDLEALDQSEAPRVVEAARAQMIDSQTRLHLLQQRMQLEWGTTIAAMAPTERTRMINAIADGKAALVRADVPGHHEGILGNVMLDNNSGGLVLLGSPLGFAATLDARLQTIGLLTLAHGDIANTLRPGRLQAGYIETDKKIHGLMMPRAAIVRLAGQAWVYRRTGPENFERVALPHSVVVTSGWLVQEGFAEGDNIVVSGAASLLAAETAALGEEE